MSSKTIKTTTVAVLAFGASSAIAAPTQNAKTEHSPGVPEVSINVEQAESEQAFNVNSLNPFDWILPPISTPDDGPDPECKVDCRRPVRPTIHMDNQIGDESDAETILRLMS